MPHDVFISHSHRDKTIADAICARLEGHGIRCWIAPRDVPPAADWAEAIVESIASSRVFVLIFSGSVLASKQVKREITIAANQQIAILPIRTQNIAPTGPFAYYLSDLHWLDVIDGPMEKHLTTLAHTIERILGKLASTVAPQASPTQNTKINPIDGAEMVRIPPGEFLMGDDDQPNNRGRMVTLSGYWIYKNVVTVAQYKKFCQASGAKMPDAPDFNTGWSKEDHPIVNVNWNDAQAYCKWAGVTLPTEAQWEKAARGTDGRKFPWGDDYDANKLWASKKMNGDAGGTTAVGRYGIGPYGSTDMAGNVLQWCSDWYDESYMKNAPPSDPAGPESGKIRVLRGGSWDLIVALAFRASYRNRYNPDIWCNYLGFRCAAGQ